MRGFKASRRTQRRERLLVTATRPAWRRQGTTRLPGLCVGLFLFGGAFLARAADIVQTFYAAFPENEARMTFQAIDNYQGNVELRHAPANPTVAR